MRVRLIQTWRRASRVATSVARACEASYVRCITCGGPWSGGRTSSRTACLSRTSHGHARGPVFQSESPVPSLKLTRSALHRGCSLTQEHDISRSDPQIRHSDTAPRTHRPFSFACRTSISSYGYLPHHLVDPLLFGSVLHRPSSRHCLASHSGRLCHENCSPQPSLSSPSGVSSSSVWLA